MLDMEAPPPEHGLASMQPEEEPDREPETLCSGVAAMAELSELLPTGTRA